MNKINDDLLEKVSLVILNGIEAKIRSNNESTHIVADDILRDICNIISKHLNIDATDNWAWDFLIEDFAEGMAYFTKEPFHIFMDTIEYIALDYFGGSIVKDINEVFQRYDIEYNLTMNRNNSWTITK